jgi:hypothetical protein
VPTILREAGFRLYFYSHEPNEPPHIHIDRAGATAKLWLEPVALASASGFSARDLGTVLLLVRTHRHALLEAWHDFFHPDRPR